MPRFIDISAPLQTGIAADPPGMEPEIDYLDHQQTADDVCRFFPGLKPSDLPGSEGWAIEKLRLTTHNGTHLDAPYHFHSTMNGGERAATIDEVPLEWCFSRGAPRRNRDRLLPPREAAQPRGAAGHGVHDLVLPVQDRGCVGGVYPRGGDSGQTSLAGTLIGL